METTKKTQVVGIKNAGIVIICCLVIAVCIFQFLLGNPSNFMNNDPNNHPLNMLGTIYKGGIIVPIIQTLLLTVLALSIERYFALRSAFGKGSLSKFVANIKDALAAGDMKKAQEICDKQRGSVANVVTSTLRKYEEMEKNTSLPKEQKLLAIQKELEEATALEMPMMQQNLPIIATITTLGTLMGLLGTVIGMIGAVGLALLLQSINVKGIWYYFIIGFFFSSFLKIGNIGITLVAVVCVAMAYYNDNKQEA